MESRALQAMAGILVSATLVFTAGCTKTKTLLDDREKNLGISSNIWGADHREFHRVLHYPNGVGLRFPGYIVGIEKGHQGKVVGPKEKPDLLKKLEDEATVTKVRRRLLNDSKAHFISHVMRYQASANDLAVYPNRMRSCALYSALPATGKQKNDDANVAKQLFSYCDESSEKSFKDDSDEKNPEKGKIGAFEQSWSGIKMLRNALQGDLSPPDDQKKPSTPYSHIFIIVMGWNTPQGEAVQNFNSIIGHLIDEVDARRKDISGKNGNNGCTGSKEPECTFRPLVIGVTWASDWEISPVLPLPPAAVRLVSFPFKADDAEEVGTTWLRAVIEHAVLPVRNGSDAKNAPPVIIIGHSFGARAAMAAITEERVLNTDGFLAKMVPVKTDYKPGDKFISLQGAFKIEELFTNKNMNALHDSIATGNLEVILTASEFDEASDIAFWATYAGSIRAYDKVCKGKKADEYAGFIDCTTVLTSGSEKNYGFALCQPPSSQRTSVERRNSNSVLFIDASAVINCRASFTSGGSHSDIYRRETARFLWEHIRSAPVR